MTNVGTDKHVQRCPICKRPFIQVPGARVSNACPKCTREAEKNSGLGDWKRT